MLRTGFGVTFLAIRETMSVTEITTPIVVMNAVTSQVREWAYVRITAGLSELSAHRRVNLKGFARLQGQTKVYKIFKTSYGGDAGFQDRTRYSGTVASCVSITGGGDGVGRRSLAVRIERSQSGRALRNGFLIQFWMLASPVAYPSSMVPQSWRWLYGLNPMSGVIEGFRWALTGHGRPPGLPQIVSAGMVVLLLAGGLIFFQRMESTEDRNRTRLQQSRHCVG